MGDDGPAMDQCRDKAGECCASRSITHGLPTTIEDIFGSLLDKMGNGSPDQSLGLQVETVEKVTISFFFLAL